ncbi:MAG: EAL domain-containing protein [Pseudomonadota bacterium]
MDLQDVISDIHRHTEDVILVCRAEPFDHPGPEIVFVNDAFTQHTGYTAEEVIGRTPRMFQGPETDIDEARRMGRELRRWKTVRAEVQNYKKNGELYWSEIVIRPIADETGWYHYWVSVQRDVTERRKLLKDLEESMKENDWQARHDGLTGLLNRRGLDEVLAAAQEQGDLVLLYYADLDLFKAINDTLGHAAGDAVLVSLGQRLRELARAGDHVARIGGDEFVLLRRSPGDEVPVAAGTQMIAQLSQPVPYRGRRCHFGVSMGAAYAGAGHGDFSSLMSRADMALYRSKQRGRNRIHLFDGRMARAKAEKKAMSEELAGAVANKQLLGYFMPQVSAQTGELVGAEVLARWPHPNRGLIQPNVFVPLAEELKLIPEIDAMMLAQALELRESWRAQGFTPPRCSVNVSARRLLDPNLIPSLQRSNIPPDAISFELVESVFLDHANARIQWTIDALRDLRIGVEIDDFGTGHASIMGLRRIKPDRLKIDAQFMSGIETPGPERDLLLTIVEIGSILGISVVAEGIETQIQAEILTEMGCDTLQGYLYGAPMPADLFFERCLGGATAQTRPA